MKIQAYIKAIHCEDATKFKLQNPSEIDILLSETMQNALVKEQQVPIMMNLVKQLKEDVLVIPSTIRLELALMNTSTQLSLERKTEFRYKKLKTILDFDKTFICSYIHKTPNWKTHQSFELCQQLPFRPAPDEDYDKLVLLTSIQVYENEWIKVDTSSLTIPKMLFDLNRIPKDKKEIALSYFVSEHPDFRYELS